MHIYEKQPCSPNTILTKCAKMTEEGHRRHGLNGSIDRNSREECQKSSYSQGGRLKFFKDGKFILELERAREGERVSWVSVPRKTFWPPQGIAYTTPSYRQESSTSLSISDDNSSVQSSPWQRDHSWKQTNPSRNISKELSLFFFRPKQRRLKLPSRKRRRPYSTENDSAKFVERTSKVKTEKRTLLAVIQGLIDKNVRTSTPPRCEVVVSPRKRFLREMEKDSKIQVEDSNLQKRSRCKPQTTSHGSSSTSPASIKVESPVLNGVEETKPPRSCSYSITSLLAEDRYMKRSPSNSPSHYPSPAMASQAHYSSPTTEDRWYSESVDRLRSIELSQVENCGYGPYPPPPSYLGPYMYPFHPVPPYYGSGVYGRGYVMPSLYHASQMPIPVKQEMPSCSWSAEPLKEVKDRKEESCPDMPLNLSKHSG